MSAAARASGVLCVMHHVYNGEVVPLDYRPAGVAV
jgi:hypothetical protein